MKKLLFVVAFALLIFYIMACSQKPQEEANVIVNSQDAAASGAGQAAAESNSEFEELSNTNPLDSSIELLDLVE